jgi:predicted RND superfamily exporter protein
MPIYLILTVISRLGKTVGGSPWITILVSLMVCAVCMIGFLRFEQESRGEKLWVPSDAKAQSDKEWVEEMFPEESAQVNFILEESNVLTADIMKQVHWCIYVIIVSVKNKSETLFII